MTVDHRPLTIDLTPNPKERGRGGDRSSSDCGQGRGCNDPSHGSPSRCCSNSHHEGRGKSLTTVPEGWSAHPRCIFYRTSQSTTPTRCRSCRKYRARWQSLFLQRGSCYRCYHHAMPRFLYCRYRYICSGCSCSHLAMDTLVSLAIRFPLSGLVGDVHPLDNAHAEHT